MRRLTTQNVHCDWSEEQDTAFQTLKDVISSDTVITYFNPKLEIKILIDVSPVGLDAIMSQGDKTVAYASRSLTDIESRYVYTVKPKEMLWQ